MNIFFVEKPRKTRYDSPMSKQNSSRKPKKRRWRLKNRRVYILAAALVAAVAVLTVGLTQCARQDPDAQPAAVTPEDAYGLPVTTSFVPEGMHCRPGIDREIRYIVIHETGNPAQGADAAAHSRFLSSDAGNQTSWHYTVDDHEAYHHIPDDEVAWHAGDQRTPGGGNMCGVGVELCVNADGDFERTFDNGAKLTAYLLDQYGLGLEAVKQHADFMEKNCPEHIRDQGRWQEFLDRVAGYRRSQAV